MSDLKKNSIIIFVHMPKCAGKSIKRALIDIYSDRLKLYYLNPRKKHSLPWIPSILRPNWPNTKTTDVIYGHFCFDKFKLYELFHEVNKGMFFRHPIDILCSSYFYRKEKHPDEYSNVTLMEYAGRKDVVNIFKLYLGLTKIEDLDFVGMQHNYEMSIKLFEKIFNKKLPIYQVNRTQNKPHDYKEYLKHEGTYESIVKLMKKNITIYEKAEIRFKHLIEFHGIS